VSANVTTATVDQQGYPTRRGTELMMLVFAVAMAAGAYAIIGLNRDGSLPQDMIGYGGGLAIIALICHLAVRWFTPYADPLLLSLVVLVNGLGLALIHRLDYADPLANRRRPVGNDASSQLLWTVVGVTLFIIVLKLIKDHRTLQRYTYTAMAGGIVLLAIPAILPAAYSEVNGARIWIRLGGFSIQPGEFAKLILIVFFSGYLVAKRDVLALASKRVLGVDLPRARDLGPLVVAWGASLLILIFEKDLGTSLLFFGVFVVMLYVATERTSWVIFGVTLFFGGAFLAFLLFAHVQRRVDAWLNPFADPDGSGFQMVQSLFGFASGGLLGTGLGEGHPELLKFAYKSDFILVTVGEELGLTGLMALIMLYGFIVQRGLRTAMIVRDSFGKLLATGLSVAIALQVFVVVGGVTKLIPLTGMTLPFLAYGGSSLVANWAIIALLLRISDGARRPAAPPPQTSAPDQEMTQVVKL
jgi:cell division protein FtsW (lipid II flippase)